MWVFVKAKNLGVTLQWDKGTTIMVRVDPEHKGKVEGDGFTFLSQCKSIVTVIKLLGCGVFFR